MAWKAHPIGGPFVNAIGYGLLAPAAGWVVVGISPTIRTAGAATVVVSLVMSLYFAAQAFQRNDDSKRGYRTLVVTHGPRRTLQFSRRLLVLGCALVAGMGVAGWLPRLCGFIVPAWYVCDRWLVGWMQTKEGGTKHHAEGYVLRLLILGLIVFAAALADFGVARMRGGPVAGLATPGFSGNSPVFLFLCQLAPEADEPCSQENRRHYVLLSRCGCVPRPRVVLW